MSRLTRVIAPLLARAGLDIRPMVGADGHVHELVVTNPRYPNWGRVVIDRDGLMEWDYWGNLATDHAAADVAHVIMTIIGNRAGDDAERYGQPAFLAAPEERDRPHP
jgi:hypothetical protein